MSVLVELSFQFTQLSVFASEGILLIIQTSSTGQEPQENKLLVHTSTVLLVLLALVLLVLVLFISDACYDRGAPPFFFQHYPSIWDLSKAKT